jgi:hypothetical protein
MIRLRWVLPLVALLLLVAAFLQSKRLPMTFTTAPAAAQSMGAAAAWNKVGSYITAPSPSIAAAAPSPSLAIAPESNASGAPPSTPPAASAAPQQIVLQTMDGAYTDDQLGALEQPLADALRYVQERTGMTLKAPVTVQFSNEQGCSLSGVAYTKERRIVLFVCPDTELRRATAILAHEFVHQLAADHYGAPHYNADLMLSEGLAQWGMGKYALGEHPDFRSLVQKEYPYDLLPLTLDSREVESFVILRHLYDQWASYAEWIIATKGRTALDELYIGGDGRRPGSAPYERVLGMPLDTAEQQWKAWIEQ